MQMQMPMPSPSLRCLDLRGNPFLESANRAGSAEETALLDFLGLVFHHSVCHLGCMDCGRSIAHALANNYSGRSVVEVYQRSCPLYGVWSMVLARAAAKHGFRRFSLGVSSRLFLGHDLLPAVAVRRWFCQSITFPKHEMLCNRWLLREILFLTTGRRNSLIHHYTYGSWM